MKKTQIILTALVFMVLFSAVAFAQNQKDTAQIVMTWQANNFYPANYMGKPLATPNTPVTVSAEVIQNGKFIDLSEAQLTWYVDDELKNRGQNIKETSFLSQKAEGDSHFVRVVIKLGEKNFENSIRIPVAEKSLVIEAPYPGQFVKAESKIFIQAIPYFFNIASIEDLSFRWQVNDKKIESGTDNQLLLNLGKPATANQTEIQIMSFVQNRKNQLEFSEAKTKLTIY